MNAPTPPALGAPVRTRPDIQLCTAAGEPPVAPRGLAPAPPPASTPASLDLRLNTFPSAQRSLLICLNISGAPAMCGPSSRRFGDRAVTPGKVRQSYYVTRWVGLTATPAPRLRSPAPTMGAGQGRGRGTTRGADCDASTQRARCAGAFGGESAVSGSAALFLFNEAAEQVGGGGLAGWRWAGLVCRVRGTMGTQGTEAAA